MPDNQPGENIEEKGEQGGLHPETIIPPFLPNLPDTPNAQQVTNNEMARDVKALEDRLKAAEKWMIWLTGAIAFFALCQVIVALLQWGAMKGQLKEMRDGGTDTHTLAEAAKKSSGLAFIQAEAQAAADCETGTGITDDLADAYLIVSCVKGNVYSTIKVGEFIAEVDSIGRNRTLWKSQKISIEPQTIAPSGISRRVSFSFARYSREDFYALKQVLKVQGFFDYDDGFGRIIHKPFCTYFHVFRDQAGGIYRGLTTTPCDQLPALLREYAAADQQQRQQHPKPN